MWWICTSAKLIAKKFSALLNFKIAHLADLNLLLFKKIHTEDINNFNENKPMFWQIYSNIESCALYTK